MHEWAIKEVKNGFILIKRNVRYEDPYTLKETLAYEETFVFNTAIELTNWIRVNFKQDRDEEHTEK